MSSIVRPQKTVSISDRRQETKPSFSIDALVTMIEGIRSSTNDIHGEVVQSRTIASETLNSYAETSEQIDGFDKSTVAISKVVNLIDSVAARTKMLGLNASIEAAKAGDSGKGFAVVAGEVKALANQTSSATQTVRSSIDTLSASGAMVRNALDSLKQSIERLAGSSDTIENGTLTQTKILETLHEESLYLASQFKNQNNLRLENAAQNVVQLIVRNLYERTADVRWWATDSNLVDALRQDGTLEEEAQRTNSVSERLSHINRFYSVYRNLILLSKEGQAIACSNLKEFGHLIGNNLAKQEWFRRSISTSSGDAYHAANVFFDPHHADQAVSIFGTAVREGGKIDGRPIGALCVVFDWESQAANVVCKESGLSREDLLNSRVLLLDKQLRIIGDSTGRPSLKRYPLNHQNRDRGTYTDIAGNEVSFARTLGYEEFDGLGYIGMIETPSRRSPTH